MKEETIICCEHKIMNNQTAEFSPDASFVSATLQKHVRTANSPAPSLFCKCSQPFQPISLAFVFETKSQQVLFNEFPARSELKRFQLNLGTAKYSLLFFHTICGETRRYKYCKLNTKK